MSTKKTVEMLEASASDANLLTDDPTSQWRLTAQRFRGQTSGMIGLFIVVALICIAFLAPLIAPYDPNEVLIGKEEVGPREKPCVHVLGCPEDQPQ
ncbi:MAG: ABC transporter permease, partial [Acidimicrobiia bacterium]